MMHESLDTIVARCKLPISVKITPRPGRAGLTGWQIIGPGDFRHYTYRPEHAARAYFDLVNILSAEPVSPIGPPSAGKAAGLCDIVPMVSR